MLAYAANRPVTAVRKPSPNAMLAIIAAHVAVVAVVMSAKMELPPKINNAPIVVDWIKTPQPPPPNEPQHTSSRPQAGLTPSNRPAPVPPLAQPTPLPDPTTLDPGPSPTNPTPIHDPVPLPPPSGITAGAQLATPPSELKPPYPGIKLASEEEAVLKLRLTIDPNGRVVAVDPVGRADRVFLEAARRHLLAHWRYKPAMEDGHAVTSTTVITLRFQLDA
jgi:protein TonB